MIIAETRMDGIPESCTECDLFRASTLECPAYRIWFGKEDTEWLPKMRPDWCPLREVEKEKVKVIRDERDKENGSGYRDIGWIG